MEKRKKIFFLALITTVGLFIIWWIVFNVDIKNRKAIKFDNISNYDVSGSLIRVESDNDIFNIDNVTLNFSYGHSGTAGGQYGRKGDYEFICFAFYFYEGKHECEMIGVSEEKSKNIHKDYRNIQNFYYIKELSYDEFNSEKYLANIKTFSFFKNKLKHKENLKVPKEVFENKIGSVGFCFAEIHYSKSYGGYCRGVWNAIYINYEYIDAQTVRLSEGGSMPDLWPSEPYDQSFFD